MALFKMLDMSLNEFNDGRRGIYHVNKNFFNNINNYFYFANIKKTSRPNNKVRYGNANGGRAVDISPNFLPSAAVLIFKKQDKHLIKELSDLTNIDKDGLFRFKLTNNANAYFSIIKIDEVEQVGFVIPNDEHPRIFNFPFSRLGKTTYKDACNEKNTLPYMVENDLFINLFPHKIKEILNRN